MMAADSSSRVVAMHMHPNVSPCPGITLVNSAVSRGNTAGMHPWLQEMETKVIRGEAVWQSARKLRDSGFEPDVICAHPGWGEALFVKDVWPKASLLSIFEFYYHASNQDVGFDPEFPTLPEDTCRLRLKNINNLLALEACDAGLSPTSFQRSLFPAEFLGKIRVIHEGIDTDALIPNSAVTLTLSDLNIQLTCRDEIITFVNRNLEPYRGWHTFVRSLPELLERRPKAHVLIVGGDDVSYGSRPTDGVSYKHRYLKEVINQIDIRRVHFLGTLSYSAFVSVLQISSAHVYLTYPFVLSWSMLEAMSCGALVIGSNTAPVKEIISDGDNGLLIDFFSTGELVAAVDEVLSHPDRMQTMRDRARKTIVERYDLKRVCLPQQRSLIQSLAHNKNT